MMSAMKYEQASVETEVETQKSAIDNCANIPRREILTMEKTPLNTSSADNVMKGEESIPENISYF